MCGICGIVYRDNKRGPDRQLLSRMADTLFHRGPDDGGEVVIGSAGLGMRRLSIIDILTGHQPMSNEDGSITIVFNGEIYNYRQIRRVLEDLGHRFRTNCDTETIVHGYESWGVDVCTRLNGMFGFALWDNSERVLVLARDRLGIKPLYYYTDEEKLVFGSEIKAILKSPDIEKHIDPVALNNYLSFEYIPAPRSIFKEIRKLMPGHLLIYKNGRINIQSYWKLNLDQRKLSEEEAAENLRELLKDSVRLRLISDVPLGAFLSGGIDSSIMVSQMALIANAPVKTFSIGFKESSYNELRYARSVARRYETEHHEFVVEPKVLELTEKLISYLDEPFGDFSIFPTYLVSKMARDYVTVALSGDGGDELFAGYDTYRAHMFDRIVYSRIPRVLRRAIIESAATALRPTSKKKGAINSFKRYVMGTMLPDSLYHARWMAFLQEWERERIFSGDLWNVIKSTDHYDFIHRYSIEADGMDDITRSGYIDLKTYLVDDILVKVDRMSMATSLEARVPYLDHRIVEFAFSLPPELKMRRLKTKYILKKTFWNDLPEEVQKRDKQGFSIPIKNWIRGELRPMMMDLLNEKRIREEGFFNFDFISHMIDEHLRGIENHSHKLWALMVFETWYDKYGRGATI